MKILITYLAILSVFFPWNHGINGEYIDSLGNMIIVNRPKLTYIRQNGPFDYDTLAICDLTHVQNHFYLINSDVTASLLSSRNVELTKEENGADSLTVILQVPFSRSVLSIGVSILDKDYSSTGIKRSFLYPKEQKCTLPRVEDDFIIALSIEPLHAYDYEPFDLCWANYLGVLYLWDYIKASKETSMIVYSNQKIDDRVFDRFNIQSEYLIIKKSSLKWRGVVFKKINKF